MSDISTKLTYLNTTKGKIKDVINMSEAGITDDTFRSYPQKLYDGYVNVLKDKNTLLDNMPKSTSTGTITDAADLPVYEDKMSKESSQDGTPTPDNPIEVKTVKGYRNLFDKNLLVNKGFNTVTGAITTENSKLLINEKFITLSSGTYTISMEYVNQLWILAYDDDGNNQRNYYQEVWNTNNPFSFTVTDYHKIRIGFNRTINDTRQDITSADVKIMLSKGSIALPYVPYGTNWIYKKIIGKNWCNSKSSNKYCDSNGTIRAGSTLYLGVSDYIKVSPGTQYTITFEDYNNGNLYYGAYDENKRFIKRVNAGTGQTFTLDDDVYYIFPYLFGSGYSTINGNIQIEKGAVSTEYEEYKESIVTLPLRDNEIAGKGDYQDEYIIDKNGHCWLNKKIGKVVLDGSENWTSESIVSTLNTQRLRLDNAINTIGVPTTEVANIMSNLYIPISSNSLWFGNVGIAIATGGTNLFIYDTNYNTGNVNDFKSMLSNNNLVIYYPLATPQLIDLNYTVDLTLFEGVNNISNSEDMDMEIKYIKDTYE